MSEFNQNFEITTKSPQLVNFSHPIEVEDVELEPRSKVFLARNPCPINLQKNEPAAAIFHTCGHFPMAITTPSRQITTIVSKQHESRYSVY